MAFERDVRAREIFSHKSAVLDVTDTLPMADRVADLMAMADHIIQEGNKKEKAETEEEIFGYFYWCSVSCRLLKRNQRFPCASRFRPIP